MDPYFIGALDTIKNNNNFGFAQKSVLTPYIGGPKLGKIYISF